MRQTTKDKMLKTAGIFAGPAIVLYIILTFIFMAYEPQRFITVPNPCKSMCYDFVVEDGKFIGIEHYPDTIQKEVEYMGIGDYMLLVPIKAFFIGGIGFLLFVIIFRGYHFIKDIGHKVTDIWKP